ncbi:DUF6522 family protein [Allomesorhizobium camelthorni]|uniref:Uncharacterized protein n=1 Tax=Allomesorhizobium camelthorni TaxID=475069 RepID=A0A6G4WMR4_9HYPH|nr:DUF6522 family protein [Mesorhizobium camelthorni]NGO55473.1 hypothetical protein [Mesorhizobium camelthorni]
MIQRDAHPICVNDGVVTIDAAVLAPKLGLSVGALQTEMRRGTVLGVVERGQDEDAGRIRLTFRHGSCTWGVVVEPDGRLADTPPPVGQRVATLFDLARRAAWD